MKVIEIKIDDEIQKWLMISHRFYELLNIICSGRKIYQLPCYIGKRGYYFKEITPKEHMNKPYYLIESKRYSERKLKKWSIKVSDRYLLDTEYIYPF